MERPRRGTARSHRRAVRIEDRQFIVTGVGSLIHLYSIGYMHGDPKFSKFFLYLNLFVLSMTVPAAGTGFLSASSQPPLSCTPPHGFLSGFS